MDIGLSLAALRIEGLGNLTLKELKAKLNDVSARKLTRPQILETLMRWLHEQIKKDAVMQEKSLLPDFMDLLMTRSNLELDKPFNEKEICQVFKEWQIKDAAENPANRRRYLMAHSEIQHFFQRARYGSNTENNILSLQPSSQSLHEDSSALWNEGFGTEVLADTSNRTSDRVNFATEQKQKTGANEIPLGKRKPLRAIAEQEDIKVEDDEMQGLTVPDTIPAKQKKGFLPQETLTVGEINIGEDTKSDVTVGRMPKNPDMGKTFDAGRRHFHGWKHQSTKSGFDFSRPTPPLYVCKRCGKPGKATL
ncbi:hypothetical protein F5B20DRAFT_579154 [Whalleya microplaca]|nr:hypothetical protein F5B20DRAFT_579154 [Whalleya microplaca]